MTLTSHPWKLRYRSHTDDLIQGFYIPALSESCQYDRGAGFFSSSALAIASKGVARLIENQGKMRLLVSHHLSEEDVKAVKEGYELRHLLRERLYQELDNLKDAMLRNRIEILSWMIRHEHLEVKVAVMTQDNGDYDLGSLFHEKIGIFTDRQGNQIAFEGSVNESASAWARNQESFSLFLSWEDTNKYIQAIQHEFNTAWEGQIPRVKILNFTQALQEDLIQFLPNTAPIHHDRPERQKPQVTAGLTHEAEIAQFLTIKEAPKQGIQGKKLSFTTCTIEPLPHQQRVFLKASERFPERFLFADEVGLGKTIEAGSLIRYLLMSKKIQRVLLLVPKSVMRQWHQEIYEKFNLWFWLYNGKTFESIKGEISACAGNPWEHKGLILASSHLVKRRDRRDQLLNSPHWDLVILDEAHHARRQNPSRKNTNYTPNLLLKLMEGLTRQTQGLFLLSATPMQVEMIEAWDLLKLLGIKGDWARDSRAFLDYYLALQEGICADNLKFLLTMCRSNGTPDFELEPELKHKLEQKHTPNIVRQLERYIRKNKGADIINRLKEPHVKPCLSTILHEAPPLKQKMFRNTREQLREYHQKGLLKERIATRYPDDFFIDFSPLEWDIYQDIDDYIKNYFTQPEGQSKLSLGFVSSIYKRRATSSLTALKLSLERRKDKLAGQQQSFISDEDLDEDLEDTDDLQEDTLPPNLVALEIEKINDLLWLVSQVQSDTKFDSFIGHLKKTLGHGHYQAIVFTQYTDTLDYIKGKILHAFGSELACYSGRGGEKFDGYQWLTVSKDEIKQQFKDQKIQILLCTDAASEGLNLQTSSLLYNYDMPWNPMRVEQRIGRVDRIGQARESIKIVNFYYQESVEAKIYKVLRDRIDCFSTVIGNLQPILATISRHMTHLSLNHDEYSHVIEQISEEIEQAQTGLDIGQFADHEITYALDGVEPPITEADIESAFVHSKILAERKYHFAPIDEIPDSYALTLPSGQERIITFKAKVFDENPVRVEHLSYLHPLFEQMLDKVLQN